MLYVTCLPLTTPDYPCLLPTMSMSELCFTLRDVPLSTPDYPRLPLPTHRTYPCLRITPTQPTHVASANVTINLPIGDDNQCVGSKVGTKTVIDVSNDDLKEDIKSRALQRANIYQRFAGRQSAVDCIRLNSTLQGQKVLQDRNRSGRYVVRFVCATQGDKFKAQNTAYQCDYHVVVRRSRTEDIWTVDRGHSIPEHCHNCISRAKISLREARILTTDKSVASINDTIERIARVNKIPIACVPRSVGVEYRKGSRYTGFGSYEVNWAKLDQWGQQFVAHNPGSKFHLDVDEEGRFKRMFVGIGSAARVAQKTGIEFSGIDGTFLTHYKYNGTVLILVTRDGNNQILVLAWVVCDVENISNYQYMAKHIKTMTDLKDYLNRPRQLMYSDRHKGIPAFENEFECGKAHCIVHIAKNVRTHVKKEIRRKGAKVSDMCG